MEYTVRYKYGDNIQAIQSLCVFIFNRTCFYMLGRMLRVILRGSCGGRWWKWKWNTLALVECWLADLHVG